MDKENGDRTFVVGDWLSRMPPVILLVPTLLVVGSIFYFSSEQAHLVRIVQLEIRARLHARSLEKDRRHDPLQAAVVQQNMDAVRRRLDEEPQAVRSRDDGGKCPLHLAVLGSTEIATLLLQRGADANCQDLGGMTPLAYAARWGKVDMSLTLLKYGASASTEDFTGQAPLHYAARYDHVTTAWLLLRYGAPLNHRDSRGLSALDIAKLSKRDEMVRFLAENGASRQPASF